jgi:ribosome recycling factor
MDARLTPYVEKMGKTLVSLSEDFKTIRAGRANPAVLNKVRVEYYGSQVPISQVGNITVPEARILQIAPWEPNMVKAVIKAINMSDIGINPSTDGKVIRLVFPELTEERRKDLSKDVRKKGEEAKVAIRNIRRDADKQFKKLKDEISEDVVADLQDDLQKETDKKIKEIDKAVEEKTKEILTV